MFQSLRRLGRETFAYGIASVATSVVAIFLVPFYTRVLTPADYGLVALTTAVMGVVSSVVVLGLDGAAGRWYFDDDDETHQWSVMSSWFWCQLVVSATVAMLIIVALTWAAPQFSESPDAQLVMTLAALAVPLSTFRQVAGIWLRCNRLAWRSAVFSTLSALATVALIAICVLVLREGVVGVFIGQLLGATVTAAIATLIVRHQIQLNLFSGSILRAMLSYGLPLVPTALAGWITASSDRIVLNWMMGATTVGLYSIAASISSVVALFTFGFQFAWGPFAYSVVKERDGKDVLAASLSWFTLIACLLASSISIFASEALHILTTPAFYPAATSVPYLAFSWVALGVMSVVAVGANIAKRSTAVAVSVFLGAVANVVLNVALIPVMGRDGAGAATLIAYVFAAVAMYLRSQVHFPIPYKVTQVLLIGVWSALAVLASGLLPSGVGLFRVLAKTLICASFIGLVFICRLVTVRQLVTARRRFLKLRGGSE